MAIHIGCQDGDTTADPELGMVAGIQLWVQIEKLERGERDFVSIGEMESRMEVDRKGRWIQCIQLWGAEWGVC
jgi:hypothetical protein